MGSCGIRRPASSVVVVAQMVHDILADLGDLLSGLSDLGFGLGNLRRETSLAGGNLGRYEALDVPRSHPRCTGDGRDDYDDRPRVAQMPHAASISRMEPGAGRSNRDSDGGDFTPSSEAIPGRILAFKRDYPATCPVPPSCPALNRRHSGECSPDG